MVKVVPHLPDDFILVRLVQLECVVVLARANQLAVEFGRERLQVGVVLERLRDVHPVDVGLALLRPLRAAPAPRVVVHAVLGVPLVILEELHAHLGNVVVFVGVELAERQAESRIPIIVLLVEVGDLKREVGEDLSALVHLGIIIEVHFLSCVVVVGRPRSTRNFAITCIDDASERS